ncbi:MAG: SDR family oxidoreductase [Pseudomonadota bacterium]
MVKTALITGGSKRIGAAISRDLAAHGYSLAVQYAFSTETAELLAEELRAHGVKIELIHAELTGTGGAESLFREATAKLGAIDLLVNNASIFENDTPADADTASWDKHFDIHVRAPSMLVAQMAAQPELESGLVVNMIDQRVLRLNPSFYSYTLSKTALWTATRTLAQTYAPKLRVNAIGPGPTLQNARQSENDFQRQIDGLLLKRGPELDEFGRTIRFLYETKSITGQMLALDGGQHLAWETPDIAGIPE